MRITPLLCFVFMLCTQANAQYKIDLLDSNTFVLGHGVVLSKTSFRGLSVVDDQNIWVSGSRGTIALSTNGGQTFTYTRLKGYENSDFRDIEAFDGQRAIVMSSGTPAYILKTTDGGQTWKEVYKNTDSAYFLDAMDFWDDKRGVLVGDPVNGHFVLLQTNDGGETWNEPDTSQTPIAMKGEAVFAASGTSLRCWGKDEFGFVSGGTHTRMFVRSGIKWSYRNLQIQKGLQSQGAFSLALVNEKQRFMVTGGNYVSDTSTLPNSCYVVLSGHVNHIGIKDTKAYKSCVESLPTEDQAEVAIATGISGSDLFKAFSWTNISGEAFNVVRKAKKGNAVFLAGPKGKIGKLIR
ncbi:MAG: YCF48-related protein [Bacteroidota bacterium]